MTTLVLSDGNSTRVEYVTDLLPDNNGLFTVFETKGLDAAEIALGLDFRQLTYDTVAFEDMAEANNLKLERIDARNGVVVVVDYTEDSSTSVS